MTFKGRGYRSATFWNVFLVHSFSGVPAATGAISVAASAAISILAQRQSLPGLADPLNFNLTTVAYLGPLSCGASALHTRNLLKRGIADLASTSVRGRHGALMLGWAAIWVWQTMALLIGLAITLFLSVLDGPAAPSMWLLTVLALAVILTLTLLGAASASYVDSRVLAPAVTVLSFALLFGLSFLDGRAAVASVIWLFGSERG